MLSSRGGGAGIIGNHLSTSHQQLPSTPTNRGTPRSSRSKPRGTCLRSLLCVTVCTMFVVLGTEIRSNTNLHFDDTPSSTVIGDTTDILSSTVQPTEPSVPTPPPLNLPYNISLPESCIGKEHFVRLIVDAKLMPTMSKNLSTRSLMSALSSALAKMCDELPLFNDFAKLYGNEPVVVGMETCPLFRERLSLRQKEFEKEQQEKEVDSATLNPKLMKRDYAASSYYPNPAIRVAGMFNTGTNAMAHSLHSNLNIQYMHGSNQRVRDLNSKYRVPWGKHHPLSALRYTNIEHDSYGMAEPINQHSVLLPIVLVRDPYRWMQSMCKESYDAVWKRTPDRCPNLAVDTNVNISSNNTIVGNKVTAYFKSTLESGVRREDSFEYKSLADYWSQYYLEYYRAGNMKNSDISTSTDSNIMPRLMIRFEDMLFHAPKVMAKISQCAGVPLRGLDFVYDDQERQNQTAADMIRAFQFNYLSKPSKAHGQSSGLLDSIYKYSHDTGRYKTMLPADLELARRELNSDLMTLFHYKYDNELH